MSNGFGSLAYRVLEAINDSDPGRRRRLLSNLLDPSVVYADPHLPYRLTTLEQYLDFLDEVRSKMPLMRFELLSTQSHNGFGAVAWRIFYDHSAKNSRGYFVCELTAAGTISSLIGWADFSEPDNKDL